MNALEPRRLDAGTLPEIEAQADDLMRGFVLRSQPCFERVARFLPELDRTIDEVRNVRLTVTAARLVVAREYGFLTWGQLRHYLELTGRVELLNPPLEDEALLRCACLTYANSDRPSQWQRARELLAAQPDLATRDIYHASAVGNVDAVRRFLDDDPTLVERRGGPFDWEPLLFACYSRLNLPEYSTLEVARLLLDRGASPNAHFMWGGQYRFTALTGAFGHGEAGPANQPEHPAGEVLARLLLDAGACANDSQALYNRMFADQDSLCLKLLLQYGLNASHRCNWRIEEGGFLRDNPQQTLQYQLSWAVRNYQLDRARLLVEQGAELSTPAGQPSFYEMAKQAGEPALAEFLVQHGAERVPVAALTQLACAGLSGDGAAVDALLADEPKLLNRLQAAQPELLHRAAASNRLEAVRILAERGADLNLGTFNSPLHEAAWNGHVEMVRLLIELGADLHRRDDAHAATPLQWAAYNGKQHVVEYLATCEIDIFDCLACNNLDRLARLLDAEPSLVHRTLRDLRGTTHRHDSDWQTPLALAVLADHTTAVRLLLERGASIEIRDFRGRSLLERARQTSSPATLALLESAAP